MFGGRALYLHGMMKIVLMEESESDKTYKDKTFEFPIWRGILLPTFREHHESLKSEFPELVNHPVLPKWLYLQMSHPDFEGVAAKIAKLGLTRDPRFGIEPSSKVAQKNLSSRPLKKSVVKTRSN